MKSFRLISVALLTVLVTACTDYVGEIDEVHNEYVNLTSVAEKQGSGCLCYISGNPLYDYASKYNEPITWRVDACRQEYNFQASLDYSTSGAKEAGAMISDATNVGWGYKVDVLITVGGPYFQTNVGLDIDVFNADGSFVESLKCEQAVVYGIEESSVVTPEIPSYTSSSTAKSSSSAKSSLSDGKYASIDDVPCDGRDLWCKNETSYQILTGLDIGFDCSGYWFDYYDDSEGGVSRIDWPVPRGTDFSDYAFDNVIDYCKGLCGAFTLNRGTLEYNPFVGVGFNLGGAPDDDCSVEGASVDASAWGGICIVYESSAGTVLKMGLGTPVDASMGYGVPEVTLPKTSVPIKKCYTWNQFKQPSWVSKSALISGDQASAQIVALKFEIQDKDGTQGTFNIIRLWKYSDEI